MTEEDKAKLTRMISGALKVCITAHGPITKDYTSSAAKRVISQVLVEYDIRKKESSNSRIEGFR